MHSPFRVLSYQLIFRTNSIHFALEHTFAQICRVPFFSITRYACNLPSINRFVIFRWYVYFRSCFSLEKSYFFACPQAALLLRHIFFWNKVNMHVFALSMHLVQFREVSSDISLRRDFKQRKCRKNQMSRVKIKPTELPRQLQVWMYI